ncbi:MAG TPA: exopolysaccharide biosynthesis polyprenyl glycosylphosphotransferase [Ktedonobacterales bacterium]
MTTHHGWNNNGAGSEPDGQRPLPPNPWETSQGETYIQNGWGVPSTSGNYAPGSYQPVNNEEPAPRAPRWNPPAGRDHPEGWHPASPAHPVRDPSAGGQIQGQPYGPPHSYGQPYNRAANERKPTFPPPGSEDDDNLEMSVTARMARLSRNPEYLQIERLLANRRRARARLSEIMLIVDVALSLLLIVAIERFNIPISSLVPQIRYLKTGDALVFAGVVLFVWPVVFSLLGLYRSSWVNNIFAPLRAIITVGLAGLAVSGILYFLVLDRMRVFWLTFVVLDAVLLALARIVMRPLARLSAPRRRILIIGTGRLAIDAARAVATRSALGLEIIGVVGPEREFHPEPDMPSHWQEALYRRWVSWRLGDLRDAPRVIREKQVDLVLIALSPRERSEASWLVSSLANLPVQLYVLPDVVTETAKTVVDVIDGIPVIGLTEPAISGWNARIKRMMDLAICIPLLLLVSPLMLIIALLIRLDSSGPALFKQERIGQHNRRFTMLKFRTMRVDTEQRMKEVAEHSSSKNFVHKQRDNPNITRVGAILRRTSLDELPQLINILKGDMSVVGPRPELPWIVERYRAWQYRRLLVPQGLTGWWQVNGRSNRVLHLHTQDDIFYVRNYSLWLDIKILLMTVKIVLTGRGAF